jgi:uncharacterized protein (DUF3084 family)
MLAEQAAIVNARQDLRARTLISSVSEARSEVESETESLKQETDSARTESMGAVQPMLVQGAGAYS